MTRLLFNFGEILQQNRADIKELQREVRELSVAVQLIVREMQHQRENEAHEPEKMALRLESEMLKFEKRLPPSRD